MNFETARIRLKKFGEATQCLRFKIIELAVGEEGVYHGQEGLGTCTPAPKGQDCVASSEEVADASVVSVVLGRGIGLEKGGHDCFDNGPD